MIERYIVVQDRMGEVSSHGTFYQLVVDTEALMVMARVPLKEHAQPIADALNLTAVVRDRVAS